MTATPNTENELRAALALAHVTSALIEAAVSGPLAAHVAGGAKYSAVGNGVLIEAGTFRAVDTPESIAELVKSLLTTPPAAAGAPAVVDDAASAEAARKAGREAGQAQAAANTLATLAFR